MKLPVAFEKSMKHYLGTSWQSFINCYEQEGNYGIRCNPLKIGRDEFMRRCPAAIKEIPWCQEGFYYEGMDWQPAKHPYYHAGLFYIQEPSAMLPASLLPVEPGDYVLDLCAAPGGKSTQIAGKLQGKGLLVSNDISVSRTKALVKNLEMAGVVNAIVTSEKPEKLAETLPSFFDKILVDAPCSGEGMFRKNPQMCRDYEQRGPAYYAPLQKQIVKEAIKMLKPGGYLVYSTCTFSPEEDEGLVDWVLKHYPDMAVEDSFHFVGRGFGHPEWILNGDESLTSAYRMWPHQIAGEGHFAVLLKKADDADDNSKKQSYRERNDKFTPETENFLCQIRLDDKDGVYRQIGSRYYLVPRSMPEIKGIRIVRSGLCLGEVKKKRFEPEQALAMAIQPHQYKKTIHLSVEDERVIKYLKCETIMLDGPDGIVLIAVDGFPLGWGKLNNGRLKNKYTPAWRWM